MNNIQRLRHRLAMTQSEFAELCDISTVSISRYESGKTISRKNAKKIADVCKVKVDYILGYQPEEPLVPEKEPGVVLSREMKELFDNYNATSPFGKYQIRKLVAEISKTYPSC